MRYGILLKEYAPRHICFIDGEGGEAEGGEPVAATEVDEIAEALAEEEAPPGDEEHAELELGADKVKVPKAVKEAWDGLQKTVQTRAEESKAAAASAAEEIRQAREYAAVVSTVSTEIAQINAIDAQLEPYLKLSRQDWIAWGQQEPEAAAKASAAVNALQVQRNQLDQGAQTKIRTFQDAQAKGRTEFMAAAERDIAATIKDWSPAKRAALEKTATSYKGVTPEMFQSVAHIPGALQIIEDAMTLRAARAKAKAKGRSDDATPPEPTGKVRTTGGATSQPRDSDSPEAWANKFRTQYYGAAKK